MVNAIKEANKENNVLSMPYVMVYISKDPKG